MVSPNSPHTSGMWSPIACCGEMKNHVKFVMVRTWKHILTKMPLNQCHSSEAKIFLTVPYEQLWSIYKSLNKLF